MHNGSLKKIEKKNVPIYALNEDSLPFAQSGRHSLIRLGATLF